MSREIQQDVTIPNLSPQRLYDALTDANRFSAMSGGAPAEIEARAGGAFSLFGGMILGRNIECVPGKRVVQAWRVKTWAEGVYSLVRFEISAADKGSRVVLEHVGFPDGQAEHLAKGWHANYWEPLGRA